MFLEGVLERGRCVGSVVHGALLIWGNKRSVFLVQRRLVPGQRRGDHHLWLHTGVDAREGLSGSCVPLIPEVQMLGGREGQSLDGCAPRGEAVAGVSEG